MMGLDGAHVHTCHLCPADIPCNQAGCRAVRLYCPDCTRGIDEVDSLEVPRRPALTYAAAVAALEDATRAALATARRRPEDALRVFVERLEALAPANPLAEDVDAWARNGIVFGGRAAWCGRQPDQCGNIQRMSAIAYFSTCALAAWVVATVRNEEMGQ